MAISNELCNPTPFPVDIPWHRGINIQVPPDGKVELTVDQMDDFRDGKPGSEAVAEIMNHHCVFLRDNTRTYESQALETLEQCVRLRKEQRRAAEQRLRQMGASDGANWTGAQYEQTLHQLGYKQFDEKLAVLEKRIGFLREALGESQAEVHQTFDPERTLIFLDPPREFPSKLALQMFLSDPGNEEIKVKYEQWLALQKEEG